MNERSHIHLSDIKFIIGGGEGKILIALNNGPIYRTYYFTVDLDGIYGVFILMP